MPQKRMPEIPKDDAITRYRRGQSMASLARMYGVSSMWLADRFREWGEPVRDRTQAGAARRGMTIEQWRERTEAWETASTRGAPDQTTTRKR
jgi:hypothetical protein